MPKIICPKCQQDYEINEEILGREVECACGHKFIAAILPILDTTSPPAKQPKGIGCCGLFLVIILIVSIMVIFFKTNANKPTQDTSPQNSTITPLTHNGCDLEVKKKEDLHGAWAYSQLFVEEQLKAPKSAKFERGTSVKNKVKYIGNDVYQVNSYVDSQNSFGANIRTHFSLKIKKIGNGERWQLVEDIRFD